MKHVNLERFVTILVALFLAMTGCNRQGSRSNASIPTLDGTPTRLEDYFLCDLAVPDEDSPWHQVWRTDYGAGGIRDLIRDGDFLWVATPVDVVRLDLRTLDCVRFRLSGARSLLIGPDGRLWAARGTELARLEGQRWQTLSVESYVSSFAFDTAGNLWVDISLARAIKTFRYSGHEPPPDGPWEAEPAWEPPLVDRDECDQWAARSQEFRSTEECRLLSAWRKKLISLAPPEGIAPWGDYPPIVAVTEERVWMLAGHLSEEYGGYDTLLSFDGRDWQMLPWPYSLNGLVADEVRGGIWVGTDEGLIFSDGASVQKYLLLPGDAAPLGPRVSDLTTDGSGRLWASTDQGLLLDDEASDVWQTTEINEPALISADYQGGLWAVSAYRDGNVSHFDGRAWSHHPLPEGWPCYPPVDILADVGGGLWLSSYSCALCGFNGQVWDGYDSGSHGELLARGPDGAVYLATPSGTVKQYDGADWETLPLADPSYSAWIAEMAVGPTGEVWVAFEHLPKLVVYRDGVWEEALELADKAITALLVDSQGDLWAGYSGGLSHYDGEVWEHIESETSFATITALAEDRQGRIWVGSWDGLSVYDPKGE
jgi:hypothetical protein